VIRPARGALEECPACGAVAMGPVPKGASGFRLARCENCGHARKLLKDADDALAYAIDVEDREPATPATWLLGRLPSSITAADRLDVIDVGCWDGDLLAGLPQRWRRRGLEPNPAAAARARSIGLDVATTSLEDWPVEASSYDLVIMLDVLEHIDDPQTAVIRVQEMLRPGGMFVALTGDGASLGARRFGDRWYYSQYPEHISLFTRHGLETLLRRHGFETTVERIGHPMSGHLTDALKLAARLRAALGRGPRAANSSSLSLGFNLQTASRLLRGRDHLWVVGLKPPLDSGERS